MKTAAQGVLAVVAGVIVASVGMGVAETLGRFAFPPRIALDRPTSPVEVARATPAGGFGFILAGWAIGTFIGSSVAAKIAPNPRLAYGLAVGGLMLATTVATMVALPHPIWVWVVGVLLFLPMSFLGASLGSNDAIPIRPPGPGPGRP